MAPSGPAGSARTGRLRLHAERFPGTPILDTAISHAMLRRVAAGAVGESLRLYVPENALLFSSLDARRPGYARAVTIAEAAGFPALIRLAGGQAAAFLDASIAFAWAIPDETAHLHIRRRFEELSDWIAASLRRLGLDARVGPVPGEYCPGEYSVNLGGRVKVMGVGQRVIRGGAHVGGVLTVDGTQALRETLGAVYAALDLEFRPDSAGGIVDFEPGIAVDEVLTAMRDELLERGRVLEPATFDPAIRAEADALIPVHAPISHPGLGDLLRTSRRNTKVLVHRDGLDGDGDSTPSEDS